MALTTKQLIRSIPNEPDTKNARYVSVFATKKLGPASYLFTTVTKIPGDFSRKHKIWIRDQDAQDVITSKNIYVSCDCERFQFMWEYVLSKKGATLIRYGNGEPPVETNPGNRMGACKHVFRCLNTLAQQNTRREKSKPTLRKDTSPNPSKPFSPQRGPGLKMESSASALLKRT